MNQIVQLKSFARNQEETNKTRTYKTKQIIQLKSLSRNRTYYHEARERSEPFFPWFSKEKKASS